MNTPYYPASAATQPPVYQQPVYTQPSVFTQPQYSYPQVNYQTVPQQAPVYPQQYAYAQPQTQNAAPVQQPAQPAQVQPLDNSRIAVQFTTELVAECAALVELNRLAVNVAKEIEKTQDPEKKARLQTHAADLNQLIAMREAKVNQMKAQCDMYANAAK